MQWQKNYQAHSFLYSPCHTRIKGEHVFVCVFPICITEAAVWKFPGPSNNKIRAFSLMTLWTKNHCAGMRTGLDCISLTIIARQQLGNTFLCLWGIIFHKVHVISNFVSSSLMSPLISNQCSWAYHKKCKLWDSYNGCYEELYHQKVIWHFREACCFHLQGWSIS
jgi:hypothetical protein